MSHSHNLNTAGYYAVALHIEHSRGGEKNQCWGMMSPTNNTHQSQHSSLKHSEDHNQYHIVRLNIANHDSSLNTHNRSYQ